MRTATSIAPPAGSTMTENSPVAPAASRRGTSILRRSSWPAWTADDDVADAGMDSFPASDPPSWGPLRVGAPTSPE